MGNKPAAIFLPIIVTGLLVLYAGTIAFMIYCAFVGAKDCEACANTTNFGMVATTIGGLVSALAIAELSLSVPGRQMGGWLYSGLDRWKIGLTWAYLIAWMAIGVAALVVGTLIQPDANQAANDVHDVNQTLSDIGMAWLGLAVAAGLAYFGITPSSES